MITGKAERVRNKQFQRYQSGVYQDLDFNKLSFHEWNWELQGELLARTDIVLMPVNTEHYRTETKSANRLIDGIMSGKFVITSPLDSYQEFDSYTWQQDYIDGIRWALNNPAQTIEKITQGQAYTHAHYSPEQIAQRWLKVFHGQH
jgi:glycosyltransferase involved in cell wall biosynthesis